MASSPTHSLGRRSCRNLNVKECGDHLPLRAVKAPWSLTPRGARKAPQWRVPAKMLASNFSPRRSITRLSSCVINLCTSSGVSNLCLLKTSCTAKPKNWSVYEATNSPQKASGPSSMNANWLGYWAALFENGCVPNCPLCKIPHKTPSLNMQINVPSHMLCVQCVLIRLRLLRTPC
jgi:hypothetical protein